MSVTLFKYAVCLFCVSLCKWEARFYLLHILKHAWCSWCFQHLLFHYMKELYMNFISRAALIVTSLEFHFNCYQKHRNWKVFTTNCQNKSFIKHNSSKCFLRNITQSRIEKTIYISKKHHLQKSCSALYLKNVLLQTSWIFAHCLWF